MNNLVKVHSPLITHRPRLVSFDINSLNNRFENLANPAPILEIEKIEPEIINIIMELFTICSYNTPQKSEIETFLEIDNTSDDYCENLIEQLKDFIKENHNNWRINNYEKIVFYKSLIYRLIGLYYLFKKNHDLSIAHFQLAANEYNDAFSYSQLGLYYHKELKNAQNAELNYKKAIKFGNRMANLFLGLLYLNDYNLFFQNVNKSSINSDLILQIRRKSGEYLNNAAIKCNIERAYYSYGIYLELIEKNKDEAVRIYNLGIENMKCLKCCFALCELFKTDEIEMLKWLNMGIKLGCSKEIYNSYGNYYMRKILAILQLNDNKKLHEITNQIHKSELNELIKLAIFNYKCGFKKKVKTKKCDVDEINVYLENENMLKNPSIESIMNLAILYEMVEDYPRAMKYYLIAKNLCKMERRIDEYILDIIDKIIVPSE